MNYAAYVEAKGYNVILPAQLKAMKDFPETVKRLQDLAKKKANELFGNRSGSQYAPGEQCGWNDLRSDRL